MKPKQQPKAKPVPPERIISENEAALALGISPRAVRRLAELGHLTPVGEDGLPWPKDEPLPRVDEH